MLDILFPKVCPTCATTSLQNDKICQSCLREVRFINDWAICAKCGVPYGYFNNHDKSDTNLELENSDHLCGKCIENTYCFEKARSIAVYEGKIRDLIISFKYEGKLAYGNILLEVLKSNFPQDLDDFDYVVPVPLHIDKLRQREYNQSVILAAGIARYKGVRCDRFSLKRTRDTVPQIEIRDEKERRRNVRGAFSVESQKRYKGNSVLLIDDVFTSGSTSDECSKILLKSGAYKVQVLTLTRARAM